MTSTTAARELVRLLLAHGVTHVFCVPGESYLAVLDALADVRDEIHVIACRHEAGAANMAVAHGKLTGAPGICMVTRGPGATHASIGVHTARQDSTPMILFVGQVARDQKHREAFQEVDYAAAFGPLAKWAVEIDDPGRTVELTGRAFATAVQGRAGPVVIALPEDMLRAETPRTLLSRSAPATAAPPPEFLGALSERLSRSERPLMILGGSGWSAGPLQGLTAWAGAAGVPIALSFRRKDLIDNDSPGYIGDLGLGPNPELIAHVRSADLILAVGARLGENPTQGYSLFTTERTARELVHIHPDPEELGRVWPASLAAVAAVDESGARARRLVPPSRPLDGLASPGARRLRSIHAARRGRRTSRIFRRSSPSSARSSDPRRSSATAPATSPPGCTASIAIAASEPSWRRPAGRWGSACRRRSPPSSSIQSRR